MIASNESSTTVIRSYIRSEKTRGTMVAMSTTYEPKLLSVGFILAPEGTVASLLERRLERTLDSQSVHSAREVIDWAKFFEKDGTLYNVRRLQVALLAPHDGLTVFVCNLADGWESLYGNLVKAGAFDAYFFRATLAAQAEYKVFEMKGWRAGEQVRLLRALEDTDRWTFLNDGEAFPFESPMQYQKREIKARLDRRLMELYSEAAGYRMSAVTSFAEPCRRYWREY